jgi:hypothetical protein
LQPNTSNGVSNTPKMSATIPTLLDRIGSASKVANKNRHGKAQQ